MLTIWGGVSNRQRGLLEQKWERIPSTKQLLSIHKPILTCINLFSPSRKLIQIYVGFHSSGFSGFCCWNLRYQALVEASGYQAPSLEKGNAQATLEHLQREAPEGFLWGIHQFPMEHPPLAGVMFADFASEPFESMGIFHGIFRLAMFEKHCFLQICPWKSHWSLTGWRGPVASLAAPGLGFALPAPKHCRLLAAKMAGGVSGL